MGVGTVTVGTGKAANLTEPLGCEESNACHDHHEGKRSRFEAGQKGDRATADGGAT
jgi:hypothetical protein